MHTFFNAMDDHVTMWEPGHVVSWVGSILGLSSDDVNVFRKNLVCFCLFYVIFLS